MPFFEDINNFILQITSIRESQKKKRVERQDKYIEQKVSNNFNLKLFFDYIYISVRCYYSKFKLFKLEKKV